MKKLDNLINYEALLPDNRADWHGETGQSSHGMVLFPQASCGRKRLRI